MANFVAGSATVPVKDVNPSLATKEIEIRVPTTFVWGTDTVTVTLANYGAHNVARFSAWEETTAGSVVISATGTTSVSAGVLTFNSTGSSANTCGGTIRLGLY